MKKNWGALAKRLMALNQMGLRIEQSSGHRWIMLDENAEFMPRCLLEPNAFRSKQYGSYESALDEIDKVLVSNNEKPLISRFETHINHYNDLGVVFGEGTQ